MKRFTFVCLACLLLTACATTELQTVDLKSPSIAFSGSSSAHQTTFNTVLKEAEVIALVSLEELSSFRPGESIFTFNVDKLLSGCSNLQQIKVLEETEFFSFGENYLLFLSCHSSTLWPFDIYVSYSPTFTFRVGKDNAIGCLQDAPNRVFVSPFVDEKYNDFTNLEGFITINKREVSISRVPDFLETKDLIRSADVVIDITVYSSKEANPFIYSTEFKINHCLKGSFTETSLLLPGELIDGMSYILLLKKSGDIYKPVARNGVVPMNSENYTLIKSSLGK